jgi:ABC-type glycerol-3-phosphate transport system permease component
MAIMLILMTVISMAVIGAILWLVYLPVKKSFDIRLDGGEIMSATQVSAKTQQGQRADAAPVHKMKKSWSDRLLTTWSVLVYVFLFMPIIVIFIYSFNTGRLLVSFTDFGLDSYAALFHKKVLSDAVLVSLRVGVISAILATLLGTLAGIALARKPGSGQQLL